MDYVIYGGNWIWARHDFNNRNFKIFCFVLILAGICAGIGAGIGSSTKENSDFCSNKSNNSQDTKHCGTYSHRTGIGAAVGGGLPLLLYLIALMHDCLPDCLSSCKNNVTYNLSSCKNNFLSFFSRFSNTDQTNLTQTTSTPKDTYKVAYDINTPV